MDLRYVRSLDNPSKAYQSAVSALLQLSQKLVLRKTGAPCSQFFSQPSGARTLLGAPGLTTSNKKLLGAKGIGARTLLLA